MPHDNKKTLTIINRVHKNWKDFFQKQKSEDPLEYPTLESFTAKKLQEIMKNEGHLPIMEKV